MKKKKKWIVILIIVVVISAIILLSSRSSNKQEPLDETLVISPTLGDITVSVTETGIVEPLTKVEIKSKVAGQVSLLHVEEGDRVESGQILLALDKIQYQYTVDRAKALHEEAQIRLQFSEKKLERKKEEYKSKAISHHDLDETQMEKALAEVQLQKTLIDWNSAQDNLKHCQIRSPIAGVVIHRGVETGEMVSPGIDATVEGKPLLTIADLSKLSVKSELNQIDMAKLKLEQKVLIRFDAFKESTFNGLIHRISPAAQAGRNNILLFPIEILIEPTSLTTNIKPGMTADIDILITEKKAVLTIPIESILEEEKEKVVYVVKGTLTKYSLHKQSVQIGLENDRQAEVLEGLTPDDRILIKPKSAAENELVL
ncbi:efflux RND transporter periplasmic adaptor subunit [candidate division CSSED10-310 bacterium]|uniref:Efflux RND transporter periplasmic adaptor subunit n=1 Tax=candidate division CSSED10-310 bacterium TaxID=2855610 RepID=A0ABV6YS39_UNCC1